MLILFVIASYMVFNQVLFNAVAYHGGCSAIGLYMREYADVLGFLGLPKLDREL